MAIKAAAKSVELCIKEQEEDNTACVQKPKKTLLNPDTVLRICNPHWTIIIMRWRIIIKNCKLWEDDIKERERAAVELEDPAYYKMLRYNP